MFDLEQAIANWRQRMLAAGIQSPVPLEELEGHLRDELEEQMESGLEPQAALAVAIEKVGQAQNLKAEFVKVSPVKWSANSVLITLFAVFVCTCLISLMTHDLYRHQMNWAWRFFGLARIGLYAGLMIGSRYIMVFFPVIPNRRMRSIIAFSFLIGGAGIAILINHLVPHFGLSEGEQWVITWWGSTFVPAGVLAFWGLEEAAKRAMTAANS